MIIKWQISDGYVGGNRPHETEVDDSDLRECDDDEERTAFIYDAVQNDFEQKVTFDIKTPLVFDNLWPDSTH